ncbi:hypothetical protein D3C75_782730 [compost metagenome]
MGIFLMKIQDQIGKGGLFVPFDKADVKRTGNSACRQMDPFHSFLSPVQDGFGLLEKNITCRGQLHTLFGPDEQLRVQPGFQRHNLLGYGSLGNIKFPGGFGKIQRFRNGYEIFQLL